MRPASSMEHLGDELRGFRPPRQRRSRETLDVLVEVIGELLVETGTPEMSVRDIVASADTSTGAFYARFDNRDTALAYTCLDFWERSRALWSEYLEPRRWADVPAAALAGAVTRTFARAMLGDARRLRAFLGMSLSTPGGLVVGRIARHDRFIASTFADTLMASEGEIRHPTPRQAAEEGFRRVLSSLRDHVVYHDACRQSSSGAEDRALILCLVQMLTRYLDLHPVPQSYGELLAQARRAPPPPTSRGPGRSRRIVEE